VQAQGTAWICNVFEVPKLRNILQKLHSVSVKGEEQSHTRYPLTPAIASKEVDLYWFLMSNRKQISTPSRDFMLASHHYKTQQIRDCSRHALDDYHSLPGSKDAAANRPQTGKEWSRCAWTKAGPQLVVKWRARFFDVSCRPRASLHELELELAGVRRWKRKRRLILL
jgi:hypothetical protein